MNEEERHLRVVRDNEAEPVVPPMDYKNSWAWSTDWLGERQAARLAGAAGKPATLRILLCEQRWCEPPGGSPARATCGLARTDLTGAWLSCDPCAARMLGDARFPCQVVSLDQWRQISGYRDEVIADHLAAGKAGQLPPPPLDAAMAGEGIVIPPSLQQYLPPEGLPPASCQADVPPAADEPAKFSQRTMNWLYGAICSFAIGIIVLFCGISDNHEAAQNGTSGTPGAVTIWIGIALAVVPLLVMALAANRARLENGSDWPASITRFFTPPLLTLAAVVASILLGVILCVCQANTSTQPANDTAGAWGAVFIIVVPILIGLGWVLYAVGSAAGKYAAWKRTLTPQQRAAVNLAEAAALTGAAVALHESNKRQKRHYAEKAAERQASKDMMTRIQQETAQLMQQQTNATYGNRQPGSYASQWQAQRDAALRDGVSPRSANPNPMGRPWGWWEKE
jgi:hypothetical protein